MCGVNVMLLVVSMLVILVVMLSWVSMVVI